MLGLRKQGRGQWPFILLIVGVMFICQGLSPAAVQAQNLVVGTEQCPGSGQTVTFTVNVDNAPNDVKALGFQINYDANVMTYQSYSAGDLVSSWLFIVNDTTPGTITVAGADTTGFAAGSSGTLIQITFDVVACDCSEVEITALTDDLAGWTTQNGMLDVDPEITDFSANPTSISLGESATLSWTINGATSASIDNGVGDVDAATGSVTVSPTQTTTYTLTAENDCGTVTQTVTVTVNVPVPVITSFTANPGTIEPGGSSQLCWDVADADTVEIQPDVGTVGAQGCVTVSPSQTTSYTLTATNQYGSTTSRRTVRVGVVDVPTLGEWGVIASVLVFALIGLKFLWNRNEIDMT